MSGGHGHDGGTRGRRGAADHDEHEEHVNHEAWVIPYADLLTLLMAMFIALFAMGSIDKDKFDAVAESFRKELGGDSPLSFDGSSSASPLAGAGSVLEGLGPAPVRSDLAAGSTGELAAAPVTTVAGPIRTGLPDVGLPPASAGGDAPSATFEVIPGADNPTGDTLTEVEQIVLGRVAGTGMAGALSLRRESRGLVVTIVTDQVLFTEAQATIQPNGLTVLDVIADAIADLPNDVLVEGHTDSRPLRGGRYLDNWDLSTARATSVLRYLVDTQGFDPARLAAAGYADTRPLDAAGTPESMAKNRRVEIVVLEQSPDDAAAATPPTPTAASPAADTDEAADPSPS